ncbi:MAG: hypothetical protein V3S69_07320 [Dehalococcoidales bacterium]
MDANEAEVVDEKALVPMTRDEMRAKLLGDKHLAKTTLVTLFGVELELRQPTLGAILASREVGDVKVRTTDVFINYAYVPGTDERVFEDTDRDLILNWPFTEELVQVQEAIADLTGIDLGAAEEDLEIDPLEDSS